MLAGAVREPLASGAVAFPGASLRNGHALDGSSTAPRCKLPCAPLRRRRAMIQGVMQGGIL
jgi:hypothetical protein